MKYLRDRKAQQVMEYVVMAAVVVSTLVVFTRPSGVFRGAVNRILWMSTDQVNFAVNSLCIGPGCGSTCGDGVCSVADGEICFDPADPGPGACQLDCGLCPMCPDGTCDFGETCATCPIDCGPCPAGPCNYDSHCDAGENYLTCPDCAMPDCGNGMPNPGEQCDTGEFVGGLTDFFGQACVDFVDPAGSVNYHASCGFLVCNPYATGPGVRCTVDTSNCCWCGDGDRNGPEECEGGQLGGMDCFQLGIILGINYTGGNLKCFPDGDPKECQYDTSECWICGNGIPELGEDCEVGIPVTQMCVPYGEKAAECYPPKDPLECQFDFRNCDYCGDGDINSLHEECDKGDSGALPPIPLNLDGQDCVIRGYDCGALGCAGDCKSFNESNCHECGDGTVNCPGEECDGSDHNGETCETLGLAGGTLNCFPKDDPGGNECKFDTSLCGICGDGIATSPEECDPGDPPAIGEDLAGEDCLSWATKNGLPYDNGELACYAKDLANKCTFDVSGCTECGNGTLEGYVEGYEECDDPEFPAGVDCTAFTTPAYAHDYFGDASLLACDANCEIDPSGCLYCGDGTISGPPAYWEQCEPGSPPAVPPDYGGKHCSDNPAGSDYHGPDTLLDCVDCIIDFSGCYECGNGKCEPGEDTWCSEDCDCQIEYWHLSDCNACGGTYCEDKDASGNPNWGHTHCEEIHNSTCLCASPNDKPTGTGWTLTATINPAQDCEAGAFAKEVYTVAKGYNCGAPASISPTPCCGDTHVDPLEECDDTATPMFHPAADECADLPAYHSGPLGCHPADKANPDPLECTFDESQCAGCGDGTITNPWENCEPGDPAAIPPIPPDYDGATCKDYGHYDSGDSGFVCDPVSCLIDDDGCPQCDDGTVDDTYGEICDPSATPMFPPGPAPVCEDEPSGDYCGGALVGCDGNCALDYSNCSFCGDGDCDDCEKGWCVADCSVNPCSFLVNQFWACKGCSGWYCEDVPGVPYCTQFRDIGTCNCQPGDVPDTAFWTGHSPAWLGGDCDTPTPGVDSIDVLADYTCVPFDPSMMNVFGIFDNDPTHEDCCGDGVQNAGEDCDNPDIPGNCQAEGFDGGTLACYPRTYPGGQGTDTQGPNDCKYNTDPCYICGDGNLEAGIEECDKGDPSNGIPQRFPWGLGDDCTDDPSGDYYGSGKIVCDENCKIDRSACEYCGDTKITSGHEECDATATPPVDSDHDQCDEHPGHTGTGAVTCDANCNFVFDACGLCGNWALEDDLGEECDTVKTLMGTPYVDFGTHACTDVGCYPEGGLGGTSMKCVDCKIDYSDCPCCGDGVLQMGGIGFPLEECDPGDPLATPPIPPDMNGKNSCDDIKIGLGATPAYGPGPLTCRPKGDPLGECTINTSQCTCIGSDSLDGNADWCTDDQSSVAGQKTTLVDDLSTCSGAECEAYCDDGPPNYVVNPGGGLGAPPPFCEYACGNGKVDFNEVCDDPDYDGATCDDIVGKIGGSGNLQCLDECQTIDYSNCEDSCGDHVCEADENEDCVTCPGDCGNCNTTACLYEPPPHVLPSYFKDKAPSGLDPLGYTEIWYQWQGQVYPPGPYVSGEFCTEEAKYFRGPAMDNISGYAYSYTCRKAIYCGDGTTDTCSDGYSEVCDPGGLDGASPDFSDPPVNIYCSDFSAVDGKDYHMTQDGLACLDDCQTIDRSGCPYCLDGILQSTWEDCEPSPLDVGTGTCENQGYDGGVLGCKATGCEYDLSGCTRVCTGDKPAHSTLCTPPGGNMTASKAVNECSGAHCEYRCDPGYVTLNGLTCVPGCITYETPAACNADDDCEWFSRPESCDGGGPHNCFSFMNPTACNAYPGCSWGPPCNGAYLCSDLDVTLCTGYAGEHTYCTYLDPIDICIQKTPGSVWECEYQIGLYDWVNITLLNNTRINWASPLPFYYDNLIGAYIYNGYYYIPGAYKGMTTSGPQLFMHYEVCRKPITK